MVLSVGTLFFVFPEKFPRMEFRHFLIRLSKYRGRALNVEWSPNVEYQRLGTRLKRSQPETVGNDEGCWLECVCEKS